MTSIATNQNNKCSGQDSSPPPCFDFLNESGEARICVTVTSLLLQHTSQCTAKLSFKNIQEKKPFPGLLALLELLSAVGRQRELGLARCKQCNAVLREKGGGGGSMSGHV